MLRVVAGLIVRKGRVLVARRPPGKAHAERWELPGGKVEIGESDGEALVRELREELGITVDVTEVVVTHRGGIELVVFACAVTDGEPTALEHTALVWLSPDELGGLDWTPADLAVMGTVAEWLRRAS